MKMVKINTNTIVLIAFSLLWALSLAVGIRTLLTFENTPGVVAAAPAEWPVTSYVELAPDRPTLVMLAHPHCPCTRASMRELDRLMSQVQHKVKAYVIFIKPPGLPEDWEKTDLWMSAASIPGITVLGDNDGIEAQRFQTMTSGQTLLYDKEGELIFEGGITAARGHEGDNDGRTAIVSLINSGTSTVNNTAVFGCPLFNRSDECEGKEVVDDSDTN